MTGGSHLRGPPVSGRQREQGQGALLSCGWAARGCGPGRGGAAHFPFFFFISKQISSYLNLSSNKIKTERNQSLNKSSKNNAAA
jgi:hypothetical protein